MRLQIAPVLPACNFVPHPFDAQVFDWELSNEDMSALDGLTTPENLQAFKARFHGGFLIYDAPL